MPLLTRICILFSFRIHSGFRNDDGDRGRRNDEHPRNEEQRRNIDHRRVEEGPPRHRQEHRRDEANTRFNKVCLLIAANINDSPIHRLVFPIL